MKLPIFTAWFLAALLDTTIASAQMSHEDVLSKQEAACQANVDYLRGKFDQTTFWSSIFIISGAVAAGVGSAAAGFLSKEGQRKAGAVVGALGAVLTVLPQALPDKAAIAAKLAAADKHHTIGAKFRNQFVFASADENTTEAEKYASARFTDCAALNPPEGIPDFPVTKAKPSDAAAPDSFNAIPSASATVAAASPGIFVPAEHPFEPQRDFGPRPFIKLHHFTPAQRSAPPRDFAVAKP
jgi:hypothetical protein